MKKYYVYYLIDPRDKKVFYIGKGTKQRMYQHEKDVRAGRLPHGNKSLFIHIKEIIDLNKKIIYAKKFETNNEERAYLKEQEHIRLHGIGNLTNVVGGSTFGLFNKSYNHAVKKFRKLI